VVLFRTHILVCGRCWWYVNCGVSRKLGILSHDNSRLGIVHLFFFAWLNLGSTRGFYEMSGSVQLVVFRLDAQSYALALEVVERILLAVEVTPLPKAPAIVLGVIDFAGTILPVIDLRKRFGLPPREMRLTDQFLIARTKRRTLVLVIDEAERLIEWPAASVIGAPQIVAGLEYVQGLIRFDSGLVLIHDLETCLSLEEERVLADALGEEAVHGT
jgi:purine-binding chemotaxis protein CheW